MKRALNVAAALLLGNLAQCSSPPAASPRTDPAQTRQAGERYMECLFKMAAMADDERSDAMTIGAAVLSLCGKEVREYQTLFFGHFGPVQQNRLVRAVEPEMLKTATSIVLQVRAKRRLQGPR